MPPPPVSSVAIIGGGVAGVAAARLLARRGVAVAVYERSHLGGRLGPPDGLLAGAGTTYVKAKDPLFVQQAERWLAAGAACEWEPRTYTLEEPFDGGFTPAPHTRKDGERWLVGTPSMARLADLQDAAVTVRHTEVTTLVRAGERGWAVHGGPQGSLLGEHSVLICALPLGVARRLLPSGLLETHLPAEQLAQDFEKARYAGSFRFAESLELPFEFAIIPEGSSITVLLNDTSRRLGSDGPPHDDDTDSSSSSSSSDGGEVWVAQTATGFAAEKLSDGSDPSVVASELHAELCRVLGRSAESLPSCTAMDSVAWLYGDMDYSLDDRCVWAPAPAVEGGAVGAGSIALAGDWCCNGRVEGAWLSGVAAAQRVLEEVDGIATTDSSEAASGEEEEEAPGGDEQPKL
jgi:predicted NAD/FAD-dependent oxidoreductase